MTKNNRTNFQSNVKQNKKNEKKIKKETKEMKHNSHTSTQIMDANRIIDSFLHMFHIRGLFLSFPSDKAKIVFHKLSENCASSHAYASGFHIDKIQQNIRMILLMLITNKCIEQHIFVLSMLFEQYFWRIKYENAQIIKIDSPNY